MSKSIVFDLGGTLMEFVGMPLNWSDYYIGGFEKLNEILKLNLSENGIQESANKLKAYNPRTSKREYEIKPEVIFTDIMTNWGEKPDTNKVIELFFESLSLKANIYEYSIELLQKCRDLGFKTACLTDLPNGMPDCIFKPAIEEILPYFDLYVSSQICGVRKPNQGGICYSQRQKFFPFVVGCADFCCVQTQIYLAKIVRIPRRGYSKRQLFLSFTIHSRCV